MRAWLVALLVALLPFGESFAAEAASTPDLTMPSEMARADNEERLLLLDDGATLRTLLDGLAVSPASQEWIVATVHNVVNVGAAFPAGTRARVLLALGPASASGVVLRLSLYFVDRTDGTLRHAVTVARADNGRYVLGLAPSTVAFPDGVVVGDLPEPPPPQDEGKSDRYQPMAAGN